MASLRVFLSCQASPENQTSRLVDARVTIIMTLCINAPSTSWSNNLYEGPRCKVRVSADTDNDLFNSCRNMYMFPVCFQTCGFDYSHDLHKKMPLNYVNNFPINNDTEKPATT